MPALLLFLMAYSCACSDAYACMYAFYVCILTAISDSYITSCFVFVFFFFSDLFGCNYSLLRPDSSVELDEVLTVGANRKKCSRKHAPCHVTLCSSPSPPRPFLEIRFKYFYDVCAVTTWTNISNLTDVDFNIQFSHKGHLWYYYREMGQIKVTGKSLYCF